MSAITPPVAPAGSTERRGSRRGSRRFVQGGGAAWAVVAVALVGLSVADPTGFWSPANVAAVLTATVVLGLAAIGQHVVVLSGGIDLSVGSTATLTCLLTAVLIDGYPIRTVPVVIGVVVLGALTGAVQGALVARAGLPPFIVTLAGFYVLQGAALVVSETPAGRVTSALSSVALTRVGPFPLSLVVLLVAAGSVAFVLHRTVFGRHLLAVGGDVNASRANGLPVERTLVTAHAIGSAAAALAGVVLAARATIGSPTAGQGLELSAITVVVVGGTSLLGGRGSLLGTLGGVVLLALVTSSVTLLQLPSTTTDLVRGVVILAAAAIFVTKARR